MNWPLPGWSKTLSSSKELTKKALPGYWRDKSVLKEIILPIKGWVMPKLALSLTISYHILTIDGLKLVDKK